jgi:hypothetical protein
MNWTSVRTKGSVNRNLYMDEYLGNDEGEFLRYRGQDFAQVV